MSTPIYDLPADTPLVINRIGDLTPGELYVLAEKFAVWRNELQDWLDAPSERLHEDNLRLLIQRIYYTESLLYAMQRNFAADRSLAS